MKSTLSRFSISSATWRPTSGFELIVAIDDLRRHAADLAAEHRRARARLASFMCLPMMPAGPLSVVTKPTLTLSAAPAGAANSSNAARAIRYFFMLPRIHPTEGGCFASLAMTMRPVGARARGCNSRRRSKPLGGPIQPASFTYSKSPGLLSMPVRGGAIHEANLPGSVHRPHQARDKGIVIGGGQELVAPPLPFRRAQQIAVGIGLDRGELADAAVERDMRQAACGSR